MTDNEIIKALECCKIRRTCSGCPLDKGAEDSTCIKELAQECYNLINRQKAEIESLNKDLSDTISINHKERMGLKAEIEFLKEQRDRYMQDATDFSIKVEQLKTENELLKIGGDCK